MGLSTGDGSLVMTGTLPPFDSPVDYGSHMDNGSYVNSGTRRAFDSFGPNGTPPNYDSLAANGTLRHLGLR